MTDLYTKLEQAVYAIAEKEGVDGAELYNVVEGNIFAFLDETIRVSKGSDRDEIRQGRKSLQGE